MSDPNKELKDFASHGRREPLCFLTMMAGKRQPCAGRDCMAWEAIEVADEEGKTEKIEMCGLLQAVGLAKEWFVTTLCKEEEDDDAEDATEGEGWKAGSGAVEDPPST